MSMLTSERQSLLMSRLADEGRLLAGELARELGVSEDTIRRDLRELAARGLVLRVHGGALPASPTHRPLAARAGLRAGEKARLAAAAAGLVRDGMTLLVDGGTTNLALVAALSPRLVATVVTHSPTIAAALEPLPGVEVIVLGGRLFRHSMVALGADTAEALARVQADLLFLGITGLHLEAGLTTGDHEEARFKARLVARAAETVVLATADKIGAASPFQVAPLSSLGTLVAVEPPAWLPGNVAVRCG
jgi:DeoR/GlpR family transcriptional regulator of sugar metabolism